MASETYLRPIPYVTGLQTPPLTDAIFNIRIVLASERTYDGDLRALFQEGATIPIQREGQSHGTIGELRYHDGTNSEAGERVTGAVTLDRAGRSKIERSLPESWYLTPIVASGRIVRADLENADDLTERDADARAQAKASNDRGRGMFAALGWDELQPEPDDIDYQASTPAVTSRAVAFTPAQAAALGQFGDCYAKDPGFAAQVNATLQQFGKRLATSLQRLEASVDAYLGARR